MVLIAAIAALTFPTGTVTISGAHAPVIVHVQVATTQQTWERGLMFRRHLDAQAGMLFVFPQPIRASVWMKNTYLPLSVAFYDSKGKILRIMTMTPCRHQPCPEYSPGIPFRGALEVNRGAFRRWHVFRGDKIVLRTNR